MTRDQLTAGKATACRCSVRAPADQRLPAGVYERTCMACGKKTYLFVETRTCPTSTSTN